MKDITKIKLNIIFTFIALVVSIIIVIYFHFNSRIYIDGCNGNYFRNDSVCLP